MKRSVPSPSRSSAGYTLIEILVATTLALLLLGAVVAMFGNVAGAITDSRSMLEAADRLRLAEERLQMDLAGVTVTMNPPRDPANNEGYFEYIEGPITAATASTVAKNTDVTGTPPNDTDGRRLRRHPHVHHPQHRPAVRGTLRRHNDPIRRGRSGVVRPRPHVAPPRAAGRAGGHPAEHVGGFLRQL